MISEKEDDLSYKKDIFSFIFNWMKSEILVNVAGL